MFCQDIEVAQRGNSIAVALPMSARDGDSMMAYLTPSAGGYRVSDKGSTMMRLSYEHDLSQLLSGARSQLLKTILSENGLEEDDGEFYLDVSADDLAHGLFTFGQGLTRAEDIGLWTRGRVESTFYDDLRDVLHSFLPNDAIEEEYVVPGIPNADMYPVDYYVHTNRRPLYLFGVNGSSKARLATIILQHLQNSRHDFDSLVVCADIDNLPKRDRNRLMNAANDVVPTLQETSVIQQKVEHRLAV